MNINKIITETINHYLNENIFDEKKKYQDEKEKSRDVNLSGGDEARLRDAYKNDKINLAAVARELYPDHTPQGAQSQLRKKIEGETNDNGSEYHLNQKEAGVLRKELNKLN